MPKRDASQRSWLRRARGIALVVEMATLGAKRGKVGVVVVKRRAGSGKPTHRLVVMTQTVFEALSNRSSRRETA